MKNPKKKEIVNSGSRRTFIKKLGMGIIATSAYTVISATQLGCKHEVVEPTKRGGY